MTLRYWHNMTGEEVARYWQTDQRKGLTPALVNRRLKQFGYNHLREAKKISVFAIFLSQFRNFMVVVLLVVALLSGLLGQWDDALTIMAIVIINTILGFIQEFRAEHSLLALKKLSAPEARCRRQGQTRHLPAAELVPGDIIELEAGDRVPADARLLTVLNLECDESALTGESLPTRKNPAPLEAEEIPPGDRHNMVFAGTMVTRGKGEAIVVATGMNTEIGRIAGMLEQVEDDITPLQERLAHLGQWLVAICFLICLAVVVLGIGRGQPVFNMVMAGISLAVAAIPEGLPAIVTVALALGVQRMIRRRALVRKLPAVETLGCATVICSDKTGTLTKNEMTVEEVYTNGSRVLVSGKGYVPRGSFQYPDGGKVSPAEKHLRQTLLIAALCNNCRLKQQEIGGLNTFSHNSHRQRWSILGDPTEGALLVAAAKVGLWQEELAQHYPRVYEVPFEAERRRMTTVHNLKKGEGVLVCTKGAPDVILDLATGIYKGGNVKPLTPARRAELAAVIADMTGRALRVLAVAMRSLSQFDPAVDAAQLERDLVLVGLIGMMDPPREEVPEAIARCQRAGIRVVIVTGDHPNTATAIARALGILRPGSCVLTGRELDAISQRELEAIVEEVAVYARVSPRHKLRIVRALKKQGHIVAMTGDGVNDAPAVKEADIGIAMGLTGTDVTKEASAIVIQDDNFATIVAAVEEGRAIYDNIRKFIRYLLGCNIGEVMTMFLAALLGLPLPLIPIQILWVNLVTDGLPALALGVEPPEAGIMERAPRYPGESIFSRGLSTLIVARGLQIGIFTLIVYIIGSYGSRELLLPRTMAFTTLVMLQLVYVFECRSEAEGGLRLRGNPYLVLAVFTSICLHLMVLYCPLFTGTFQTFSLAWYHWVLVLIVVALPSLGQHLLRQGMRNRIPV